MTPGPTTSWQIDGEKVETVADFIFLGSKPTTDPTAARKLKDACSLKAMTNLDNEVNSRHYFADTVLSNQKYEFCSSHI